MGWLGAGATAFLLFLLYDIASVTGRFPAFRAGFFLGCGLLLLSTAGLAAQAIGRGAVSWRLLWGLPSLLFLALLLYTLFFALPFSDTYVGKGERPALYKRGVYALCRHPGVLWLMGFYLFLWLALGTGELLAAFALFSLLDIGYVVFQDRVTFMRMFDEYGDYRKATPFLLPTAGSVRDCLRTLGKNK